MTREEMRLSAELKSVEDSIGNLIIRIERGDFDMAKATQQLKLIWSDIREGRIQIAQTK